MGDLFVVQLILKTFTHGEFLSSDLVIRTLAKYVCSVDMKLIDRMCEKLIFLICGGFDEKNINIVSTLHAG